MGGICVDTGEDLGPSLTANIHVFVGVAGANWGSFLCVLPFGSCNLVNGMICGSRFLNDINSRLFILILLIHLYLKLLFLGSLII